jgi:hypothetical protein
MTYEEVIEQSKRAGEISLKYTLAEDFKTTDSTLNNEYSFIFKPSVVPWQGIELNIDWFSKKITKEKQEVIAPLGSGQTVTDMGVCLGYFFESEADTEQDTLYKDTQTAEEYKTAKLQRLDSELTALNELTALITTEKANIEAGGESTMKEIKPLIEYLKTLKNANV